VSATYLERLGARSRAAGTVLCLGLDPDPATIPERFAKGVAGLERFAELVLEAGAAIRRSRQPNLAFFEAFGSAGIAALERLRATIPADIPVIADAKRGDIGSTAARQAVALFDVLGADAVTVSPYLGEEAIRPLLEREDRFAYVLCRTSNPGAGELQDLRVLDRCTRRHALATLGRCTSGSRASRRDGDRRARSGWSSARPRPRSSPTIRASPRAAVPRARSGAQGGAIEPVLGPRPAIPAGCGRLAGLLVNVSRGIAGAITDHPDRDPGEAVARAAADWARRSLC
jgi:orotidine-5'-phosphate decarboxylase